jgi:hypothetical protein
VNANMKLRISFVAALTVIALGAFGCGAGGGTGGETGGGSGGSGGLLPLTIQNQISLAKGLVGQPYSGKLQATGGAPPYTWTTQLLGIGGLTLTADGTISGTPNVVGTFIPTFTVADSHGTTATGGIEIDIYSRPAFTTPASLPDQNVALPISMYIEVNGGDQPYTFSLDSNSTMPPGLTFTSAVSVGLIQGTPTAPGNYSFTLQVTDSFTPPLKISQTFTLSILNRLVLPNSTLPDAVENVSYTEYLRPVGGTPPYHFALASYPLPPGILLDPSSGKVYGTPAVASPPFYASFPVTITDSASPPASINPEVTLTVQPTLSISTTSVPDSARGLNYGAAIYTLGGRPPYTIKVTNGALPNGLTATASWINVNLTGVPTTDGLFIFTAQVSDSYEIPNTVSRDFQIRISDQVSISGPSLVQILYNQNYSTTFPATGGFPPYTWSIDRPVPGFTFDPATGSLTGAPLGVSYVSTSPNVTVHDSSSPPLTATYYFFTLEVWGKLGILTTSLPTIATGGTTWLGPFFTGGAFTLPYSWSVSSGSLPPGLNLGALTGIISGSPTAAGVYKFNLNIADGNLGNLHQTTSQPMILTVKDRGQMTRNDTVGQATALSSISLLASISPFSDSNATGPDVDVYSMSAVPGSIVQLYANANNDFIQPPEPNSLFPVLEVVDSSGNRYQTCSFNYQNSATIFNSPCINGLNGMTFSNQVSYAFQVPGTGSASVTFYVRVSDARGDARPDFIYTFTAYGVD